MTHGILRTPVVLALVAFAAPPVRAQHFPDAIRIPSCPAADSLLGASRLRTGGSAVVREDSAGRRSVGTGTRFLELRNFHFTAAAQLTGDSAAPIQRVKVDVSFIDPGLYRRLASEPRDTLWAVVDDSLRLMLGPPRMYPYDAEPHLAAAYLWTTVSPATFLALARARRLEFRIHSRKGRPSGQEMADVQAVFRAAYCPAGEPVVR